MTDVDFLPVPDVYQADTVLEWDLEQLSEWLQGLLTQKIQTGCEKICRLLLHLKHADLSNALKIKIVQQIVVNVDIFSTKIDREYLDASTPLSEACIHALEWLVWSQFLSATIYLDAARQTKHRGHKSSCLFRALQQLANAYGHISATYCQPLTGFWQQCHQIFSIAERENLLSSTYDCGDDRGTLSINTLYKSIVMFSLCDFHQFRPREMRAVFLLMTQYSSNLELSRLARFNNKNTLWSIDLQEDTPPLLIAKEQMFDQTPDHRFVDSGALARLIYDAGQDKRQRQTLTNRLSPDALSRVIKTLGKTHKRLSRRLPNSAMGVGVVGYGNIISYLTRNFEPEKRTVEVPARPVGPYDYDTSQFSLVTEGEELVYQMDQQMKRKFARDPKMAKIIKAGGLTTDNADVWDAQSPEKAKTDVTYNDFSFHDSSLSGHGVLLNYQSAKVRVGDLFYIQSETAALTELAFVRRLQRINEYSISLGLESIAQDISAVMLGSVDSHAFILYVSGNQKLDQPDSLIFNSTQHKKGNVLKIKKNGEWTSVRLMRVLRSTVAFTQMEVESI